MPQLWAVLRAEMEAEAVSQEEVRRGVEETAQVREARAREEEDPALVTHIFDIHRNETVQFILRQVTLGRVGARGKTRSKGTAEEVTSTTSAKDQSRIWQFVQTLTFLGALLVLI